jgi:hypothetical protein
MDVLHLKISGEPDAPSIKMIRKLGQLQGSVGSTRHMTSGKTKSPVIEPLN